MVAFTWFAMLLVEAARFYEEYNLGNNYEEYNLGDTEYDQEESYEDATLGDSYEDAELGEGMEDAELEEGLEEADYNLGEVFQQANFRSQRLGEPTTEQPKEGQKKGKRKSINNFVRKGYEKANKKGAAARRVVNAAVKGTGSAFVKGAGKVKDMFSKKPSQDETSGVNMVSTKSSDNESPGMDISTEAGTYQDCLRVNVRAKHHDAANAERMLILGVPSQGSEGKMHRFRCAYKDNAHLGIPLRTQCTETSPNGRHVNCETHEYDTKTMSLVKSSSQSTVKRSHAKSQHLGSPRRKSQSAESRGQHSDRTQSKARRRKSRHLSSDYKYY